MDAYLYRLRDFNFGDKDDDEYAHLMETKLTNVLAMEYGYFNVGMNYMEIYPHATMGIPSKPILVFNGKEQKSPDGYSLLIPFQSRRMAKELFSKWLSSLGYKNAAKAVKENDVTHLNRISCSITKDDKLYAKRLDKTKTEKRITHIMNDSVNSFV